MKVQYIENPIKKEFCLNPKNEKYYINQDIIGIELIINNTEKNKDIDKSIINYFKKYGLKIVIDNKKNSVKLVVKNII